MTMKKIILVVLGLAVISMFTGCLGSPDQKTTDDIKALQDKVKALEEKPAPQAAAPDTTLRIDLDNLTKRVDDIEKALAKSKITIIKVDATQPTQPTQDNDVKGVKPIPKGVKPVPKGAVNIKGKK
jgi:hypothetical protein